LHSLTACGPFSRCCDRENQRMLVFELRDPCSCTNAEVYALSAGALQRSVFLHLQILAGFGSPCSYHCLYRRLRYSTRLHVTSPPMPTAAR